VSEPTPELRELRSEIAEIDRAVLEALNRRLELVVRVREHKEATGTRFVDAEREAALLRGLADMNPGPLSESAVRSLFSAVLDVMKQETAEERHREPDVAPAAAGSLGIARLAVVGTGLVGTSVALAAKRAGAVAVSGFDTDPATLREAASRGAFDTQAASLADALAGAELVVVAVPVGAAVETTRAALAAAGPDATVTDVASTKRALAAAIDDPRFVPGHPVAGGETGGPARAAADLFDGATWFVTPTATTDAARLAVVERLAAAVGARPVRQDADEHDRLLALTSHLPHALANLLIGRVAAAAAGNDAPLEHAGASLRDMTRIAGANPSVWIDIFVENGDLIADALQAYGADLEDVERALRTGDRAFFERTIAGAADTRSRMLAHAYRTEATQINRIRIRVPDRPGVLAQITQILGTAGINIEDFELRHVSPEYGGVLVILVNGSDPANRARALLRREGYAAA
jgi:prephenate dehydrogenase